MAPRVPPYFDHLIAAFHAGVVGRLVHLGHWDEPPAPSGADDFTAAQARLDARVLGLAGLHPGQAVLDVGCGFGGTLAGVNAAHGAMDLVGVNVDPRQLGLCRGLVPRPGNRLRWVQADACRLPFPGARFDRVLCIEALFHFASRRAFFQEASRVLRPGGVLAISDITVSRRVLERGVPGACIEALLVDGYGPWPDLWSQEGGHEDLAAAAGLACTARVDATASTRPSHRHTAPPDLDPHRDPGSPTLRAALVLRWLHEAGLLRYEYLAFRKPGPDARAPGR